jgi:hypothetical protein
MNRWHRLRRLTLVRSCLPLRRNRSRNLKIRSSHHTHRLEVAVGRVGLSLPSRKCKGFREAHPGPHGAGVFLMRNFELMITPFDQSRLFHILQLPIYGNIASVLANPFNSNEKARSLPSRALRAAVSFLPARIA